MDASTDSSIDDLAAHTTIEDYGNIRQQQMGTPLYPVTLVSRLQCMTPPLDEEEENKESRELEAQARTELENEGCPPCYPPGLDIPLQNPPEKYQVIISYWKSFPGTEEMVLCAQLSDWRKFRTLQGRARYRSKTFSNFLDEVRKRRRRHGLGGDARLLLDPKQQSRLENLMEFQDHHLKRLERFEKRRDELKKELDVTAEDAEAVQQELEDAERDLEWHKVLLGWIEQQRRRMDPRYLTPVEDNNDWDAAKAIRRTSTRNRQTRRAEASAILGKARVTKAKSKAKSKKHIQPKALEIEPAIPDVIPQRSISQPPKRREIKPRRTKQETPLGPVRPQRVSKARRFGQTRSPDRARSKRRPAPQRPQPVPEDVTTRSGRISRPPVRWAPE